ncbi:MAG: CARDB domain-containing protein [Campylobacterota bacterium]|nr:CARDB domain-containing protein [Campylobacterota bacterium]
MKKLLIVLCLVFAQNTFASSDYDKDIIVHNQTRDDKIKIVFTQLMEYYEQEDAHAFFNLVWEDRFIQDYMTFSEAIDEDFRKYEITSFDSWIDKIVSDGIKKYLHVRWEKRYETNDGDQQITQKGLSQFLFDEDNGQYKLIEIAGNHLWGNSLLEWKEEVAVIAGQEPDVIEVDGQVQDAGALPDLRITDASCAGINENVTFTIINDGEVAAVPLKYIEISNVVENGYSDPIDPGETVTVTYTASGGCNGTTFEIDPDNEIEEEDEDNNSAVGHGVI